MNTGAIIYAGTRFDASETFPRGRCVVYDEDGSEIEPLKVDWIVGNKNIPVNNFDWGTRFGAGDNGFLAAEIVMGTYLLAKTIMENQLGVPVEMGICFSLAKKFLVKNINFSYFEITEKEFSEFLSEIYESM